MGGRTNDVARADRIEGRSARRDVALGRVTRPSRCGETDLRESHFDENDLELILSLPHPLATLYDGSDRPARAETLSADNPYVLPLETQKRKELERTAAGLSQVALAERLRTSQAAVGRLEGGDSPPTTSTLQRVADATGHALVVRLVKKP